MLTTSPFWNITQIHCHTLSHVLLDYITLSYMLALNITFCTKSSPKSVDFKRDAIYQNSFRRRKTFTNNNLFCLFVIASNRQRDNTFYKINLKSTQTVTVSFGSVAALKEFWLREGKSKVTHLGLILLVRTLDMKWWGGSASECHNAMRTASRRRRRFPFPFSTPDLKWKNNITVN